MAAIEPPYSGIRCRNHPSLKLSGVCPACLRDRLKALCPECAKPRPCACKPLPSASEHESAQSQPSSSSTAAAKSDSVASHPFADRNEGRNGWTTRWKCLNLQASNPCGIFLRKKPAKISF